MVRSMDAAESRGVARYAPRLSFLLLLVSLILLALAPIGYRAQLWHFRTSFFYFMTYSAFAAMAASVVAILSLIWFGRMSGRGRLVTILSLLVGGFVIYWTVQFYAKVYPVPGLEGLRLPIIHDITTDTANPPEFIAVLPARQAEPESNSTQYGGPELAAQQQSGYPDIAPLKLALPPAEAFTRALETAKSRSGWTVVASDPATGRIEASQSSFFFGFTDDMVIRVSTEGSGSRVDMRSESRQGRSDFGVNAARIRSYLAALKERAG
ncbi:MAG TPA: DUF1499 domain-containing protein [Stellaceae bacterium]|nr:DUF1499 domain-containing protein [Stellaceae bacterium]